MQRLEKNAERDGGASGWVSAYLVPGFEVLAIGAFCTLWARSTGRDSWLWLAAGLVFNVSH